MEASVLGKRDDVVREGGVEGAVLALPVGHATCFGTAVNFGGPVLENAFRCGCGIFGECATRRQDKRGFGEIDAFVF